jgi:integrase
MLGKITKTVVDRLPQGSMIWDTLCVGFGARRQLRDAFYLLRYRLNGKQRFLTIGRHGSPWTPDTARNEARRLLGQVASGVDPASRPTDRLGPEIERYLERKRPQMRPQAFAAVERHLRQQAQPLHQLKMAEIDRRGIAQRLAQIETASGPIARNRARASLSAFWSWAIREGLAEVNPVTGTGRAPEGSRERLLSRAELRQVWDAAEGKYGDIVRLLMLTGQRRGEIGGLRWCEIERDRIVLPPARTKNNREHVVPLAPQARAILDRQPRQSELVFGRFARGMWAEWKQRLDVLDLAPWVLHDIRRSVATGMAEIGILPHIIEAVLNHVSGHRAGVAGIYNRARYLDDMREALERWADYVAQGLP